MSLSQYEIISCIGKGSFGDVYKVKHKQDNLIYAMKKVNIQFLSEKEKQNTLTEIRILASISNPYIISFKEAFYSNTKEDHALYIITEYINNGNLYTLIQTYLKDGKRFNEIDIWKIFKQICFGLKALHDINVIHRDIKSENVFMCDKRRCKIGDMNVSKIIRNKNIMLKTQIGTPYYASPEIWENKPYSFKSDIWSLGIVLYEMCMLRLPFEGNSFEEVYMKIRKGVYPKISNFYSKEINKVVEMMLKNKQEERPGIDKLANIVSKNVEKWVNIKRRNKFLEEIGREGSCKGKMNIRIKMSIPKEKNTKIVSKRNIKNEKREIKVRNNVNINKKRDIIINVNNNKIAYKKKEYIPVYRICKSSNNINICNNKSFDNEMKVCSPKASLSQKLYVKPFNDVSLNGKSVSKYKYIRNKKNCSFSNERLSNKTYLNNNNITFITHTPHKQNRFFSNYNNHIPCNNDSFQFKPSNTHNTLNSVINTGIDLINLTEAEPIRNIKLLYKKKINKRAFSSMLTQHSNRKYFPSNEITHECKFKSHKIRNETDLPLIVNPNKINSINFYSINTKHSLDISNLSTNISNSINHNKSYNTLNCKPRSYSNLKQRRIQPIGIIPEYPFKCKYI